MRNHCMSFRSKPENSNKGTNLVTVVIVNWNTVTLLRACLTSTMQACRRLGEPFEIIVVDNASTDGSEGMVAREFPSVKVIGNDFNAGFATANNQAIQESRSRYVMLLNPDTEVDRSGVKTLIAFLEEHPAAGVAGPLIVGQDGRIQVSCRPLPTLFTEVWRLLHLDRLHCVARYHTSDWDVNQPRQVETLEGSCMLIRRDVIDEVGFLDERFFMYSEEIDLCRRILEHNWQLYWVPQAKIMHYGGQSSRQAQQKMFLELYRSKVEYFRKHLGWWGGVAYKAVLVLASVPRVVILPVLLPWKRSSRKELLSIARNYRSLLASLPRL